MKNTKNIFDNNYNFGGLSNKRHLRADGLSLLPSALRPRLLGNVSIVFLLGLFVVLFIQNSYASNVSAASLTLSIPSTPLSVDINPSADNGFAKSVDGTISVSTAANWGYELSVKAKDDNTLKNSSSGESAKNSFSSITGPIDEATFKSGADYVNKWGFKPSKLNGVANTDFVAGPTTSPTVIEKTSTSSSAPTQYTIAIGAKVNNAFAMGIYSNSFTFTATVNTVSYNITYNLNSGTWSGTSPQTGSTPEESITLDENTPNKDNSEFQGWCSVAPTGNDTETPSCSGTTYVAGGTYELSEGTNTVTLNAIWKSTFPTAVNKGNLGSMQSFNCDSRLPNIHEYGTVTDSRDNNTYRVAKLMDGKCWMIDNLKIAGKTISSTDSDMESGSFSIPAATAASTFNTDYSNVNNSKAYVDSYGGLYTWYTATAGTGNSSITSGGVNATGSICPKGWKLPTSGSSSSGDFADLVNAYGGSSSTGSTNLRHTPVPGFTYAGYIYYSLGSLFGQGSNGYYWSSTSNSSTHAYNLNLYSLGANPADDDRRVFGYSVRCVARE